MCVNVLVLIPLAACEEGVNELVTRSSNLVFPLRDYKRFSFVLIFFISSCTFAMICVVKRGT